MKESALGKLVRLCSSISNDDLLMAEFEKEIDDHEKFSALKTMMKVQLKSTSIVNLGFERELLSLFFYPKTITEIDLHSSPKLGIKCFFMSEGTIFPIHDHPNRAIITAVLYGNIRYSTFDKTHGPQVLISRSKGTAKEGKIFFTSLKFRNLHSLYAEENSIIIDIFMHNVHDAGNYYKVLRKFGKKFSVKVDNHVFFLTRSFKGLDCDCNEKSL